MIHQVDSCVAWDSAILDSGLDLIRRLDARIGNDSSKTMVLDDAGSRGKVSHDFNNHFLLCTSLSEERWFLCQ